MAGKTIKSLLLNFLLSTSGESTSGECICVTVLEDREKAEALLLPNIVIQRKTPFYTKVFRIL